MNVLQWNELSENEAEQIAELTTVLNTLEGAATIVSKCEVASVEISSLKVNSVCLVS